MDDALQVGRVDCLADPCEQFEPISNRERGLSQVVVERFARNVLHDEVDAPVGLAGLVARDDTGVADLREHPDLSLEPGPFAIAGEGTAQHQLDGDRPACAVLDGLVDGALPAPVYLAQDGVARDLDARGVEFGGVPLPARGSGLGERFGNEVLIASGLVRFTGFGHAQPSKL